MNIHSVKIDNSSSVDTVNKKIKTISIIFGICITIALLGAIYNHIIFLQLKEDTNQEIFSLNITNIKLAETTQLLKEDFTLLNNSNIELSETSKLLKEKTDILQAQQQSLLTEEYDFLLFPRYNNTSVKYYVKSGITGNEEWNTTNFSEALKYALDRGKVVTMKRESYALDSDVILHSKSNIILDGQGATLNFNGHFIHFRSDNYDMNSNNQIRNFVIQNGTLKLENSFRATIENMIFEDCESAIELSNTNNMWSEATKLENIYTENCSTSLTFKTPTRTNATDISENYSYEHTEIDRFYINLYTDNSVGIMVEKEAHVSNSEWNNIRIWMHANQTQAQTGLHLEGVMSNALLSGVVFESFGSGTIYGVYLGEYSDGFSVEGTVFVGDGFVAKIRNRYSRWIYGDPSLFKIETEEPLTFGENAAFHRNPKYIGSFDAKIMIENLSANETVTVKITLNFMDETNLWTTKTFSENATYWLTPEDLYKLFPSQNAIWNIVVIASTNLLDSNAEVTIGVFGILG